MPNILTKEELIKILDESNIIYIDGEKLMTSFNLDTDITDEVDFLFSAINKKLTSG